MKILKIQMIIYKLKVTQQPLHVTKNINFCTFIFLMVIDTELTGNNLDELNNWIIDSKSGLLDPFI